ncbi:DUF2798 domain-containing protein [Pseudanabaena sp. UWO311]|uniref:DUF2798 domain-containing protein n=1 Tax=Pseudanabaena sp. UWO311 TaxID=2487337 RepID=UPI001159E34D|nr:DUF2798 domain-containing protein [Pseudanabaena sp. UWO311]TYQ27798.1 DUF2798 domain-containing protein [Pseudanabaena sp. UWO311]
MRNSKFWRSPRIPKRFIPYLFPLLLSGFMTLIITGISIFKVLGIDTVIANPMKFFQLWLNAYISAWLIAYPVLLLVIPVVRRLVNWLTEGDTLSR